MKTITAILLLATAGAALADTAKPADRPIVIYKAGQPFIFDSKKIQCCTATQPVQKPLPVKARRAVG
jgi:hypothetical protein